jgi:hypothetical protein
MVANTFPKKSHNYIFLISRKTNEMLQIKTGKTKFIIYFDANILLILKFFS